MSSFYNTGPKKKVYVLRLTKNELAAMRRAVVHYEASMQEPPVSDQFFATVSDKAICHDLLSLNATEDEE